MRLNISIKHAQLLALLVLVTGGVAMGLSASLIKPSTTSVSPEPTPAVDLSHARQVFESGGALTYYEVIALEADLVGDYSPSASANSDPDKQQQAVTDYGARLTAFTEQLGKNTLADTDAWVAWWYPETDSAYKNIPNQNRVYLYKDNPFESADKEISDWPDIYLDHLTDAQIALFKYGQHIRVGGPLTLSDNSLTVNNPKYDFLADVPVISTPTANELKDFQVTLSRTECYGTCPAYSLTIDGTGKVTFEGQFYTVMKGTAFGSIDIAAVQELVAEFKRADVFTLQNAYTENVTDLPTYKLSVKFNGQSKEIVTYGTSPRVVSILMNSIDQVANSDQWIGKGADR